MLSIFFQGMAMGVALILPLGPQNALVLNQGVRRQYPLMTAGFCTLSDIVLICAGIFGGSALLTQSPLLLNLVTWGGVLFLLWYGWGALRSAFRDNVALASATAMQQGHWRIFATMMSVTWLNPHVYIDTFVLLGSLGAKLPAGARSWFTLGAANASLLWFFALASMAAWLAPLLNTVMAQMIINLLVGVMMWGFALKLTGLGLEMR